MLQTAPRTLILIKHSTPTLVAEVTAERWQLSDEGRKRARILAEQLRPLAPTAIITSTESKAAETGAIIANHLKIQSEVGMNLHEHDRTNVPLVDRDTFEQHIAGFFANPDELVYGLETAIQAHNRFVQALHRVLREHPTGNPAVVTHGTVMALFVAHLTRRDPFQLWKSLGSPAYITLSLPALDVLQIVPTLP